MAELVVNMASVDETDSVRTYAVTELVEGKSVFVKATAHGRGVRRAFTEFAVMDEDELSPDTQADAVDAVKAFLAGQVIRGVERSAPGSLAFNA